MGKFPAEVSSEGGMLEGMSMEGLRLGTMSTVEVGDKIDARELGMSGSEVEGIASMDELSRARASPYRVNSLSAATARRRSETLPPQKRPGSPGH